MHLFLITFAYKIDLIHQNNSNVNPLRLPILIHNICHLNKSYKIQFKSWWYKSGVSNEWEQNNTIEQTHLLQHNTFVRYIFVMNGKAIHFNI